MNTHPSNRSEWRRGEWDNEPDRMDFLFSGFSCFVLRNSFGNWCGYVGVPNTHPCYKKSYDDVHVSVHGGLTYADKCSPPICHIPQEGMPEDVWWLGFDTAHCGDASPSKYMPQGKHESYKNLAYSLAETMRLAQQLSEYREEVVKE